MNSRAIFPALKLFKKEVVERFLIATREIYKRHPSYTYNDEDGETGIIIIPAYGDVIFSGKEPRIVVKAGAYNMHLMDTFYNNMSREYIHPKGHVAGYEHDQIININLTVLVQAYAEEESSDVADELANLIIFACKSMYRQVGLVVKGAQVSETDQASQEQELFQTAVSLSLDVPWMFRLENLDDPIDEAIIDPSIDKNKEEYRAPGVSVEQVNTKV